MKVKIFSVANWDYFKEMCEAVALSFRELGYDAKASKWDAKYNNEFGDVNITVTGHRPFNPAKLLPNYSEKILIQTEQLWNRRKNGFYDKGKGYDRVLELFANNCKIKNGTENVRYFPLGYSDIFNKGEVAKETPNYDGYFFGGMTKRRQAIYQLLKIYYVVFEQNSFGKYRDDNIINTDINLHIKAHDVWEYSLLRSLMIQCKGKFLLVEKEQEGNTGIYKPNKHFIEFDRKNDLLDKFDYWLSYPKEREDFAIAAKEDLKKNHQMTMYLEKAMQGIL